MKSTIYFLWASVVLVLCSCSNNNNSSESISTDSIINDSIQEKKPIAQPQELQSIDPYQASIDSIAEGIIPQWIKNSHEALINPSDLKIKNFTGLIEEPSDSLFDFPENKNKKFTFLNSIQLYNYFTPVYKGDSTNYLNQLEQFYNQQYAYGIGYIKSINNHTPVIINRSIAGYSTVYLLSFNSENKNTDEIVAAADNCRVDIILSGSVIKTIVTSDKITQVEYKVKILKDQAGPIQIDSIASSVTIDNKGKFKKQKVAQKRFNLKNQEEARAFFEIH